ncbi:hypothetical protein LCL97_23820 [Seohaeicola saemankumensis]|nr:hypothetical protein [Seohaeicola saemankumensis]MCA0873871.1 hypothetical protein [Seohaeicola saemankumensis]
METGIAIVSLGLLLWAVFSLISIRKPMRPFRSRMSAIRSLGVSLCALMLCALALGLLMESHGMRLFAEPKPDAPSGAADQVAG